MVWHQRVDELGPFQEAETSAVEIILVANVVDLFQLLDSIEIEMED